MPKTSLIVISDLEFGGAQRQVVELANYLEEFDAHVCTLQDYVPLAENLRDRGRRLHLIKRRWHYDFTVVPRLAKLIRRLDAKIVHAYLFDAEIASRLAGTIAGVPVVASERNTNYRISRMNWVALYLTRCFVNLTIANSNAGADFNRRLLRQPRNRYRVVHNGVDVIRFQPGDGAATRAAFGLLPEHQVVGMFASFKKQKNHPLLLRAARIVADSFPDLRILFVGGELAFDGCSTTEWLRNVSQLVDELHLRAHCVFAGNQTDVERFYRACDLTVLPSLFEGTPNVALESMSCGVPVIATNVSDNAYVIPHGRAGFVVPLGDENALAAQMCILLADNDLRRQIGRQAREWVVQEFSCARLAQKTADIYNEAIQRHLG